MKKPLLLTLALIGGGIAPAAIAATRYVPISHSYQLVEGAKYAVGAVGTGDANWKDKGPRFFNRGSNGVSVDVHADLTTFDATMLWSVKVHGDRSCTNNHADHPQPTRVVSMHQDGTYITHSSGNALLKQNDPLPTQTTANRMTEVEFVEVNVPSGFPEDARFAIHGGRDENGAFYRAVRGVNYNGRFDYYSTTANSVFPLSKQGEYTTYFEVYMQVDEADMAAATTALANGEKWEKACEKAKELSNAAKKADFMVAYMALPNPEFKDLTCAGIEKEIEEQFPTAFAATEALIEEVRQEILKMYPSADADDAKINAVKVAAQVASLTGNVKTATIKHNILGIYATVAPTGAKFYRLVSAYSAFASHGNLKGAYIDGLNLKWKTLDENDLSFYWVIESQGSGYTLRNAKTGEYVGRVAADNGSYTLGGFVPSVASIVRNEGSPTSVHIDNAKSFHCLGHSNGAGAAGNIIGYQNAGGGASAWYIQEVANEEAIRQYYKDALKNYKGTVDEADATTINSSESTPAELVKAYTHLTDYYKFTGKAIKIRSSVSGRETMYVGCGSTADKSKMPMVSVAADADPSAVIFFYTNDHKLLNVQSQKALDNNLVAQPVGSGAIIHITPSVKEGTYYIHGTSYYSHDNNGTFDRCSSNPANHSDAHSFYIEPATESDLTQLLGHFTKPELPEGTEFEIGDLPGQLVDTWEARKQALVADFSNDGYNALKKETALGIYTVAPASAGHYVRIKASAGNVSANKKTGARYLSDTNGSDNRLSFVTEPTDATLFYIAPGGYLISERKGRYVGTTNDFISITDYALPASAEPADHNAEALAIVAPQNTAHAELGAYQIDLDSRARSVHLSATDNGGNANCCSAACGKAHNFNLETVMSLPVAIQSDGWGSFYCPVPFSVPAQENCAKFYAGSMEDGTLALTEGECGHVYAGGTALLIKGTAGKTIEVSLNYGAEDADEQFANALEGTHVAMAHTNAEGKLTFAKTEVAAAEAAAVYTAEQSDEIVKLAAVGDAKPVNTLLYTVDANDVNIGEDGMLNLNVTKIASGIERVEVRNLDGTVEVYDLAGRRLAAPVRGLNIINGRKVLVK